jgi:2-polyprenyl-3-methyl-5-hydroxy-6-metoxy-1,4-benzoquinol methylase
MSRAAREAYDAWHAALSMDEDAATPWHDLVRRHLDPERDLAGKRVLEIGCGRGGFAGWLARHPARPAAVVGADFSTTAVRMAATRAARNGLGIARFEVGDVQALAHPDGSFDTVISCETVEHVPDPPRAVAELARVLRPGGRVLLTTPNYLSTLGLYRLYLRVRGRAFTEEGQPINQLTTLPRTRAWVRHAGLRVAALDAAGHYLLLPRRAPVRLRALDRLPFPMRWVAQHSIVVAVRP